MVIESWPLPQATVIGRAHLEMNPEHDLLVAACAKCGEATGILCTTCCEPLCAIQSDCTDEP